MSKQKTILVTGATGMQGGAVIDALLGAKEPVTVRALVRDSSAAAARALSDRGVQLAEGSFLDHRTIRSALTGADGVFSMQLPPNPFDPTDLDSEERAARILMDAAVDADVDTVVHTSVARAGDHEQFIGWSEGRWWEPYWVNKAAANDTVRTTAIKHRVILKPAMMMENIIPPKADYMFPELSRRGELVSVMDHDTRIDYVSAADIGSFAAAAFLDCERFAGHEIDLASSALTLTEVADIIADATGTNVRARQVSVEDALAAGRFHGAVSSQRWQTEEGYQVDLHKATSWGIELQTFTDWVTTHRYDFVVGAA